jgi:hypothetical protein
MLKRGSVQLLLLSFRSRAKLRWNIASAVVLAVLIGLVIQPKDDFPVMTRTGLGQLLLQSAWEEALSEQPEQTSWPWEDTTFVPTAKVPRLGLSAAILVGTGEGGETWPVPPAGAAVPKSDKDLHDVAVGDRITVAGSDGSSHVYKVTGRRVVDPHLAETDNGMADNAVSLVTCWPLDPCVEGSLRLVIQATPDDAPNAPAHSGEQKL